MTRETLQNILRNPYSLEVWQNLLINLFGVTDIRRVPAEIESNHNNVLKGEYIGELMTPDRYTIGLFAFEVNENTKIAINRVGLRRLVHSYTAHKYDAALAVFYNDTQWRLSFISDLNGENTSPKRYTYVFGNEAESYRTAAEQLIKLYDTKPTYKSIFDAFSIESLSKEFFDGYKLRYKNFCNDIIRKDNSRDTKQTRDYVKKMMGRLVFLQFLQKKGWMNGDYNYLQNLYKDSDYKADFLESVLEPLFFGVLNTKVSERNADELDKLGDSSNIPYLNGGLFERDANDKDKYILDKELFCDLFEFFSHYNFTIDENDPNDAEVGIDPEMLGHIFENLLEDNKDKGAFYTPKEIVQYMCKQSLIEYLKSKTQDKPEAWATYITKLIDTHIIDENIQTDREFVTTIADHLANVKICDPAIGSGAFPMGMLSELFHIRQLLYGFPYAQGGFNSAKIKREIIQNNIYGVDIEQGAVDIARLRFWLALVVDETEKLPLPNLDYKIMCGNSLIPTFDGEYIELNRKKGVGHINIRKAKSKLCEMQRSFYSLSGAEKIEAEAQIKRTLLSIIEMQLDYELDSSIEKVDTQTNLFKKVEIKPTANLSEGYTAQRRALNNVKRAFSFAQSEAAVADIDIPFFDWEIAFSDIFDGEDGGFDIIIANPPYVRRTAINASLKKNIEANFYSAYKQYDLYIIFIEQALNILNNCGTLMFINPIKFFNAEYGLKIREKLITNHSIHSVVDISQINVFENATTYPCILNISKQPFLYSEIEYYKLNDLDEIKQMSTMSCINKSISEIIEDSEYKIIISLNKDVYNLIQKIDSNSKSVSDYFENKRGLPNTKIDFEKSDFKAIKSTNVNKYYYTAEKRVGYLRDVDKSAYSYLFSSEMIMLPRTVKFIQATLKETDDIVLDRIYYLIQKSDNLNVRYVLALLNSKATNYWFEYYFSTTKVQGNYFDLRGTQIEKMPLKEISLEDQQPYIEIVTQILDKKRENPQADTSALEAEIDQMVYTLYNLTPEEINLIENR